MADLVLPLFVGQARADRSQNPHLKTAPWQLSVVRCTSAGLHASSVPRLEAPGPVTVYIYIYVWAINSELWGAILTVPGMFSYTNHFSAVLTLQASVSRLGRRVIPPKRASYRFLPLLSLL